MSDQWFNEDGLLVRFGSEQGRETSGFSAVVVTAGAKKQIVIKFTYDNLPGFTTDRDNDGTVDGWAELDTCIPANSYITNATLIVTTPFAGGTSITFGTNEMDGTVIDADGLDVIAVANLAANDVVVMDGAQVGGTATVGTDGAFVRATAAGTFTAGAATVVIEYIEP